MFERSAQEGYPEEIAKSFSPNVSFDHPLQKLKDLQTTLDIHGQLVSADDGIMILIDSTILSDMVSMDRQRIFMTLCEALNTVMEKAAAFTYFALTKAREIADKGEDIEEYCRDDEKMFALTREQYHSKEHAIAFMEENLELMKTMFEMMIRPLPEERQKEVKEELDKQKDILRQLHDIQMKYLDKAFS